MEVSATVAGGGEKNNGPTKICCLTCPPVPALEVMNVPRARLGGSGGRVLKATVQPQTVSHPRLYSLQCTRCAPTIFNAVSQYGDKLEKSHHQVVPVIETVGTPSPV